MSCGTCKAASDFGAASFHRPFLHTFSRHTPVRRVARGIHARPRLSRIAAAWALVAAFFESARRRRVWIEFEKARQRGMLLELNERLLADIGITREQALEEARKSLFWK